MSRLRRALLAVVAVGMPAWLAPAAAAAPPAAPVTAGDRYVTGQDTRLVVAGAEGVLANDRDLKGWSLSVEQATGPAHGTLALSADGAFAYVPGAGWSGTDGFTYRATNGKLVAPPTPVTLVVNPAPMPNIPPVARDDAYETAAGVTLAVPPGAGVLATDSDPDGHALSAALRLAPGHGALSLAADGSFTYRPAPGWVGLDTFAYRADDGHGGAADATVTVRTGPAAGTGGTAGAQGYWLTASDGGIFAFGDAGFYGSTGGIRLVRPVVGMAPTPTGAGYSLVASDGGIFAFGDARFFGSTGGMLLNRPMVGMAPTATGLGYWVLASDGGIFAFGDARFFGSTGAMSPECDIVGMAPTPSGKGYWLAASDGGVFAFGDAAFYGSAGALPLKRNIVSVAATPSGTGYWLVASDGGVFAFGEAPFLGSAGGLTLSQPITGMAATPTGLGYWLTAADGGIFAFGDARFSGSAGGHALSRPVVGIAARP